MNPDIASKPDTMPGVHDFQVIMPFTRRAGEGDETVSMIVRVPASTRSNAVSIGGIIAEHVGTVNTPEDGRPWRPVLDGIVATDVDHTPALDEVLAELDHWRRIVTVLSHKFPGMAQVDVAEYEAADFSTLALVPVSDTTMMFTSDESLLAPVGGAHLTLVSPRLADIELPPAYGGHTDPDVRQVRVHTLPAFPVDRIELLHDGQWKLLIGTNITKDLTIEATCLPRDSEAEVITLRDLEEVLVARPATIEAVPSDLPAAAIRAGQVLTADGWWTLAQADYMGATSSSWNVQLVRNPKKFDATGRPRVQPGDETRSTSYTIGDEVLLRQTPGTWWS